ncbi:MAG: tetratricopeptide repeat protein [bacterium]
MKYNLVLFCTFISILVVAQNTEIGWYRTKDFNQKMLSKTSSLNLDKGLTAIHNKEWATCLAAFEKVIKEDGYGAAQAGVNKAFCQFQLGNLVASIKTLEKAIKENQELKTAMASTLSDLYFKYGYNLIDEGKSLEAKTNLLHATIINPSNSQALSELSYMFAQEGNYEECLSWAKKATEANSKNSLAFSNLGLCYLGLKQKASAVAAFSKALALNSNFIAAYINRAAAYVTLKKCPQAISDMDTAIKLDPSYTKSKSKILADCNGH